MHPRTQEVYALVTICAMHDPRFNKMAQVIVHYSIEVKPGQNVYVWGRRPQRH